MYEFYMGFDMPPFLPLKLQLGGPFPLPSQDMYIAFPLLKVMEHHPFPLKSDNKFSLASFYWSIHLQHLIYLINLD